MLSVKSKGKNKQNKVFSQNVTVVLLLLDCCRDVAFFTKRIRKTVRKVFKKAKCAKMLNKLAFWTKIVR